MTTIIVGDVAEGSKHWSFANFKKIEMASRFAGTLFADEWVDMPDGARIHFQLINGKPKAFIYSADLDNIATSMYYDTDFMQSVIYTGGSTALAEKTIDDCTNDLIFAPRPDTNYDYVRFSMGTPAGSGNEYELPPDMFGVGKYPHFTDYDSNPAAGVNYLRIKDYLIRSPATPVYTATRRGSWVIYFAGTRVYRVSISGKDPAIEVPSIDSEIVGTLTTSGFSYDQYDSSDNYVDAIAVTGVITATATTTLMIPAFNSAGTEMTVGMHNYKSGSPDYMKVVFTFNSAGHITGHTVTVETTDFVQGGSSTSTGTVSPSLPATITDSPGTEEFWVVGFADVDAGGALYGHFYNMTLEEAVTVISSQVTSPVIDWTNATYASSTATTRSATITHTSGITPVFVSRFLYSSSYSLFGLSSSSSASTKDTGTIVLGWALDATTKKVVDVKRTMTSEGTTTAGGGTRAIRQTGSWETSGEISYDPSMVSPKPYSLLPADTGLGRGLSVSQLASIVAQEFASVCPGIASGSYSKSVTRTLNFDTLAATYIDGNDNEVVLPIAELGTYERFLSSDTATYTANTIDSDIYNTYEVINEGDWDGMQGVYFVNTSSPDSPNIVSTSNASIGGIGTAFNTFSSSFTTSVSTPSSSSTSSDTITTNRAYNLNLATRSHLLYQDADGARAIKALKNNTSVFSVTPSISTPQNMQLTPLNKRGDVLFNICAREDVGVNTVYFIDSSIDVSIDPTANRRLVVQVPVGDFNTDITVSSVTQTPNNIPRTTPILYTTLASIAYTG